MQVSSVRRWQWMLIGAVVGLAVGAAREASSKFSDELSGYGGRRLGQPEFERAVVTKLGGQHQFKDLVVYPYRLGGSSAGGFVQLHVVAGLFWDGRTQAEDGRLAARWEPAYFVASTPFQSLGEPGPNGKPRGPGAEFRNVLDYLASLSASKGVRYAYARWWWVGRPWFVWTVAGFVLVGIIWPTIVNLLTYGTWLRPREEGGLSIFSSWAGGTPSAARAGPAEPDLAALEALARQLEEGLAAGAATATAAPVAVAAPTKAPAKLATAADDPKPVPAAAAQQKGFGEEKDDFYPTELHGKQA